MSCFEVGEGEEQKINLEELGVGCKKRELTMRHSSTFNRLDEEQCSLYATLPLWAVAM